MWLNTECNYKFFHDPEKISYDEWYDAVVELGYDPEDEYYAETFEGEEFKKDVLDLVKGPN